MLVSMSLKGERARARKLQESEYMPEISEKYIVVEFRLLNIPLVQMQVNQNSPQRHPIASGLNVVTCLKALERPRN